MVYLMNWDVFVVVTSYGEPNTKVCSVVNEEKHVEEYERDDSTFIIPQLDRYKLQVSEVVDLNVICCYSSFPQKIGVMFQTV